jgi:adenine-specific DNA-methyltransferase
VTGERQEPFAEADSIGARSARPNLLLHGDCLVALGALADDPRHVASARLAYLDPPFNTGERSRDYHDSFDRDDWTSFMRERLEACWRLLRPDGSMWVHCDDGEQATLRALMDELFGRDQHVATVVWQRRYSRENRRAFSRAHDYIHVFAPAGLRWKEHRNRLARSDKPGMWRNDDDDPRGPWSTVSLVAQGGHATKDQLYALTLPSGRAVSPPSGSCWRVSRPKFNELAAEGLIWFGPNGDNVPRRKVFRADAQGLVPSTWWTHQEVGHNAEANTELRRLFPDRPPFSTPKPERLMLRIIELATNRGDLVLDPFAGSGTTLAVAHKAHRRWLGIESSDTTISEFTRPRLEAVVDGQDAGGVTPTLEWAGGGGFVLATCPTSVSPANGSQADAGWASGDLEVVEPLAHR